MQGQTGGKTPKTQSKSTCGWVSGWGTLWKVVWVRQVEVLGGRIRMRGRGRSCGLNSNFGKNKCVWLCARAAVCTCAAQAKSKIPRKSGLGREKTLKIGFQTGAHSVVGVRWSNSGFDARRLRGAVARFFSLRVLRAGGIAHFRCSAVIRLWHGFAPKSVCGGCSAGGKRGGVAAAERIFLLPEIPLSKFPC